MVQGRPASSYIYEGPPDHSAMPIQTQWMSAKACGQIVIEVMTQQDNKEAATLSNTHIAREDHHSAVRQTLAVEVV